jgi:hypothetical protein
MKTIKVSVVCFALLAHLLSGGSNAYAEERESYGIPAYFFLNLDARVSGIPSRGQLESPDISAYLQILRHFEPELASQLTDYSGEYDAQAIDAAILAVRRMRSRLQNEQGDASAINKVEAGHTAAWTIALLLYGKTSSEDAKERIRNEWDLPLQENAQHVASQFLAMLRAWHPDMLTERFWIFIEDPRTYTRKDVRLIFSILQNVMFHHANFEYDRFQNSLMRSFGSPHRSGSVDQVRNVDHQILNQSDSKEQTGPLNFHLPSDEYIDLFD